MSRFHCLLAALATVLCAPALGAVAPEAQVLLVATYHLSNPGLDLNNVQSDDVLKPERQAQLQAVSDALARFQPTFVGVEWPAEVVAERYPQYLAGTLAASRNEVVQLGFRLGKQLQLPKVHGLDVHGEFPFEAVQKWAQANGRMAEIESQIAVGARETKHISELQARGTIGDALRYLNEPGSIAGNHAFYPAMLTLGSGAEQPGVVLVSSWYARNLAICARLLQQLRPDDRAVVFYGQGHAYLLRQCIDEAPGARTVDARNYLPD